MTDAQLIERFQRGDMQAFNTLVWRWEKRLYNFVLRYVGDREEAKDICQKTFIQMYRKGKQLRESSRFSTWLYTIAVNLCRDEVKRKSRRGLLSLDALQDNQNGHDQRLPEMTADRDDHPEKSACNHNLNEILCRALQKIPQEQRAVIVMKEYEGLKFHEIADILGTSISTAKSRMYYGLHALKKVLKSWNITEESLHYEM